MFSTEPERYPRRVRLGLSLKRERNALVEVAVGGIRGACTSASLKHVDGQIIGCDLALHLRRLRLGLIDALRGSPAVPRNG
jgi:hypothetical protein